MNSIAIRLRLAKVVKPTYRLHIGARVNAVLLTYLLTCNASNESGATHFNNWDQQQQRLSNPNLSYGQALEDPRKPQNLKADRPETGEPLVQKATR